MTFHILDALWELASLVATKQLTLNPPEAFVYGGAVLLHDAAMTVAAYPGGLDDLKTTDEWADLIAMRADGGEPPYPSVRDAEPLVLVEVLRRLHAKKAAELAIQGWPDEGATATGRAEQLYLIEENELRHFYGPAIGSVAHSHWWPLNRVERELDVHLGGMTPKTHLTVDLLKIAALLRVADALHLDRRRAPPFVRALEKPRGISALHWAFQSKLAFPHIEQEAIIFTAGQPTSAPEAESWWLAYDAIGLADRELRESDLLLRDRGRGGFLARRVQGAGDPDGLARLIPVHCWRPVETQVRVSNVRHIVETLGGARLYGDDQTAPIRELLQNAFDAIQARRQLQNRAPSWGLVTVELSKRGADFWLSVEDNGVGMSERVLTGSFLDFGSSFWRSLDITDEFPTLMTRGMRPIGRFGIGFFSVFMLGDDVKVTTRRYDHAASDALSLEFKAGLGTRPLLSSVTATEAPIDGGTRIEVRLAADPRTKSGIVLLKSKSDGMRDWYRDFHSWKNRRFKTLSKMVAQLAPASEVSIDVIEFGRRESVIKAGDWRTGSPATVLSRVARDTPSKAERDAAKRMRPLIGPGGILFGRAALFPSKSTLDRTGVLAAGGLRVQNVPHILGIFTSDIETAARNQGHILASEDVITRWAVEQRRLIERRRISEELKAQSAEIILECRGSIGRLPIASYGDKWLNTVELTDFLKKRTEIVVHLGDVDYDDSDPVGRDHFDFAFKRSDTVLFIPTLPDRFVDGGRVSKHRYGRRSYLEAVIRLAVETSWGAVNENEDVRAVGTVDFQDVDRFVTIYSRH